MIIAAIALTLIALAFAVWQLLTRRQTMKILEKEYRRADYLQAEIKALMDENHSLEDENTTLEKMVTHLQPFEKYENMYKQSELVRQRAIDARNNLRELNLDLEAEVENLKTENASLAKYKGLYESLQLQVNPDSVE